MQYIDPMAFMMFGLSCASIIILVSSSIPNKMKILMYSSMWFPFSIGLYFYNKLTGLENGVLENVVYGVGIFSALYIVVSLGLFYKNKKPKL
ncbi:MAG: hypothetical protein AB7S47_00165 [Desulfurella sp.]